MPSGILDKKTMAKLESSKPPFCPQWTDHVQNFLNVVAPGPVHVYQWWSGSVGSLPELFTKVLFSGPHPQSNYNSDKFVTIAAIYLFMTAAETFLMTPATLQWTANRNVAISNHIQASLNITWRQASVAVAIVSTRQALSVAGSPASVVGTFSWTDASWRHCQSTTAVQLQQLTHAALFFTT